VIVAIVMFLLVFAHLRARPGRGLGGDQAERALGPGGRDQHHVSTSSGPWPWRLSSPGVAGALLAGADRQLFSINFPDPELDQPARGPCSWGGVVSGLTGAVIGGRFLQAFPARAAAETGGVPNDWLIILFGVGVLQVLTTAPRRGSPTSSPRT